MQLTATLEISGYNGPPGPSLLRPTKVNMIVGRNTFAMKDTFIEQRAAAGTTTSRTSMTDVPNGIRLIVCSRDRTLPGYQLEGNISQIFCKFLKQGRATVRLKTPAVNLFISKADPEKLSIFTHLFVKILREPKAIVREELRAFGSDTRADVDYHKRHAPLQQRIKITADSIWPTKFPANLQQLEISGRHLPKSRDIIYTLANLVSLKMVNNGIEEISAVILQLKKLRILQLSNNRITNLPKEVGHLQLLLLDVSRNRLGSLPESVWSMASLKTLNASKNQIKMVSSRIMELRSLTSLDLSSNRINFFPSELLSLQLKKIDWHDNPLSAKIGILWRDENDLMPTLVELAAAATIDHRRTIHGSGPTDWSEVYSNLPEDIECLLTEALSCSLCKCVLYRPPALIIRSTLMTDAALDMPDGSVPIMSRLCLKCARPHR